MQIDHGNFIELFACLVITAFLLHFTGIADLSDLFTCTFLFIHIYLLADARANDTATTVVIENICLLY